MFHFYGRIILATVFTDITFPFSFVFSFFLPLYNLPAINFNRNYVYVHFRLFHYLAISDFNALPIFLIISRVFRNFEKVENNWSMRETSRARQFLSYEETVKPTMTEINRDLYSSLYRILTSARECCTAFIPTKLNQRQRVNHTQFFFCSYLISVLQISTKSIPNNVQLCTSISTMRRTFK